MVEVTIPIAVMWTRLRCQHTAPWGPRGAGRRRGQVNHTHGGCDEHYSRFVHARGNSVATALHGGERCCQLGGPLPSWWGRESCSSCRREQPTLGVRSRALGATRAHDHQHALSTEADSSTFSPTTLGCGQLGGRIPVGLPTTPRDRPAGGQLMVLYRMPNFITRSRLSRSPSTPAWAEWLRLMAHHTQKSRDSIGVKEWAW